MSRLPPLPHLASVVTMSSRPGAWASARDEIAHHNVSLIVDMRSAADRVAPPTDKSLQNLAVMNRMTLEVANSLTIPEPVTAEIRRALTLPQRSPPVVNDRLFAYYVNAVHNVQHAFAKGKPLTKQFYGEHRGVLLVGSAPRWWSVERLYVQCLLGDIWPGLAFHHV